MKYMQPKPVKLRTRLEQEVIDQERWSLFRQIDRGVFWALTSGYWFVVEGGLSFPSIPNRPMLLVTVPVMYDSVYSHRCPHGVYNGRDHVEGESSAYCSYCTPYQGGLSTPPKRRTNPHCPGCGIPSSHNGFIYKDDWDWRCKKCGAHVMDERAYAWD